MGSTILIELEDKTIVEVDTPPFAGDGWRLRLENIARGGKDHYLQLKVLIILLDHLMNRLL